MQNANELPEVRVVESEAALDEALRDAAASGILTVAYFWGPQCPNCEAFARHLPGIREELRGVAVRFLKMDVYAHPDVATRFGLHGIPTFLLFRHGQLLGRMTSFQGDEFFLAVIREKSA